MNTHDAEKAIDTTAHYEETSARPGPRFADGESLAGYTTTTSEKAGSSRYASSETGLEHVKASKTAERRLVRKLDVVILPMAVLLYLSAYLDRGAMGNAKLMGLEKTVLGNVDVRYSIALMCFYITYIVFSIPGTLFAKQFLPSTTIACGALVWSIATTCQAATHNPAALYVCRLFIGVGEAFFGQAMALYLSFWYTKQELAKRIGLFISAGSLAGAFSGLIAAGVSKINSSIDNWRILFLVEGLPSLLLAIIVFFFLPSRPDSSKFLNEDERTIACTRLNAESNGEVGTGIDWAAVRYAFKDWKIYVLALAYSAMNLTLGSISGFLPTIVKGLGYSNTDAQLYSVPPYACALGVMLLLTGISDRLKSRGVFVMLVYCIGIVGWAILYGVSPIHVSKGGLRARYFACCCLASAGYANIPLIMAWVSNNSPSESQRAVGLGMLNSVGQCLSILASFLFPKAEGPRFVKGESVNLAFQAFGLVIALGMTLYFRWENARRDKREGGQPVKGMRVEGVATAYDQAVGYRYVA
ncbi:putative High-affinity nicotinic acid transporter (putative) [Rhodotorula toruloides]|uniref:FGENESH: predicted gene_5.56 protein n=1 Tax=Rhodotorula toruloides TaxID=5286 RepID=A0A0K3CDL9_RHOTO|nr:putative High-affinity nicotinic acid transporter (putative) [Rhodotorula toruloides]